MRLPKHFHMLTFGIALAVGAGATSFLLHIPPTGWRAPVLALAITVLAWAVWTCKPKPRQPKAVDYSAMPAYGTRRWARMMFKNGNCTMEELNAWFAENPNAPED